MLKGMNDECFNELLNEVMNAKLLNWRTVEWKPDYNDYNDYNDNNDNNDNQSQSISINLKNPKL